MLCRMDTSPGVSIALGRYWLRWAIEIHHPRAAKEWHHRRLEGMPRATSMLGQRQPLMAAAVGGRSCLAALWYQFGRTWRVQDCAAP